VAAACLAWCGLGWSDGAVSASSPAYRIVDLGQVQPAFINDAGAITGTTDGGRVFLYTNRLHVFKDPRGTWFEVDGTGINDGDAIAATGQNATGDLASTSYLLTGTPAQPRWTALPTVPHNQGTAVSGIASNGDIAGLSTDSGGSTLRGLVWTRGSEGRPRAPRLLPLPSGYRYSDTRSIVAGPGSIVIAGDVTSHADWTVPFAAVWRLHGRRPLVLSAAKAGARDSYADAIAHGPGSLVYIAASSDAANAPTTFGLIWKLSCPAAKPCRQLAQPAVLRSDAFQNAYINGINGNGWAVGDYDYYNSPAAFVWHNGKTVDIEALRPPHSGWVLYDAEAINDRGQIVGLGTHDDKVSEGYLLTPTGSH